MPNYIFVKAATPMNPYLERTMFTSKSPADLELCTAKWTKAFDANQPLFEYAACRTQFFG